MSLEIPEDESTIAAVSTPPGEGGVAVIRISGGQSHAIVRKIFVPAANSGFPKENFASGK